MARPLRAHHGADRQGLRTHGPHGRPHRHFVGPSSSRALGAGGRWPLSRCGAWGFPLHSLYRGAISRQADRVYDAFAAARAATARRRRLPRRSTGSSTPTTSSAPATSCIVLAPRRRPRRVRERALSAPAAGAPAQEPARAADPGLRLDRHPVPERGADGRRVRRLVPRGPEQAGVEGEVVIVDSSTDRSARDRRGARRPRAARAQARPRARLHRRDPAAARRVDHHGRLRPDLRLPRDRAVRRRSSPRATSSSWAAASAATSSPARCPSCTSSSARPLTTWILNRMYRARLQRHPLRHARDDRRRAAAHRPAEPVVGVRLRDGHQGGQAAPAHRRGAGALLQGPRGAREPPQAHRAGGRRGRRAGATSA